MLLLLSVVALSALGWAANPDPSQVHLSYHGKPDEMVVTWVTFEEIDKESYVFYGTDPKKLSHKVTPYDIHSFKVIGNDEIERWVYRTRLTGLTEKTRYYYRAGNEYKMSNMYNFKSLAEDMTNFTVCIYGDLGLENGVSTEAIIDAAQDGQFDLIIHIGDLAYDLHSEKGKIGDQFFDKIVPISAFVPYMTVAGNHEHKHDFEHYKRRLTMPHNGVGIHDNQFYSFDLGDVHFVGLSSEYYGYDWTEHIKEQYEWLKKDLSLTTKPWIIAYMHRPFYCSNRNGKKSDCHGEDNEYIRVGSEDVPGLEKLFNEKGVDICFWGHKHFYERLFPVYDNRSFYQSLNVYYNTQTPTYIVNGCAGNREDHALFDATATPYSAVRSEEYGYTVMKIHNATHIHLQQIAAQKGTFVDNLWITKAPGYRPGVKNVPIPSRVIDKEALRKINEEND
uniref:Purple acid phosphatase n=1 Tax=Steinernema glaseri TaxID=37863 RepID=A0A1I7YKF4_9BILA